METKSKHTKGPWGVGLETCPDDGIGQVISSDGWHIAKVEMYPILENTLLIAAAPDGYALIDTLAALLEKYPDGRHVNWQSVKEDCDAYLAKAKGE